MNAVEVRQRLEIALQEVKKSDRHLLENNVSERSIAARLAMYLQRQFPEHMVDAEYNRQGENPKRVTMPEQCAGYRNEDKTSLAVPDVIVHRRGPTGPNLLVLELKKTTNPDTGQCDCIRLRAFREQLGYEFGALIVCETRQNREPGIAIVEWFDG